MSITHVDSDLILNLTSLILKEEKIADNHIKSMNRLHDFGFQQILDEYKLNIEILPDKSVKDSNVFNYEGKKIKKIDVTVEFKNCDVRKPFKSNKSNIIQTPMFSRNSDQSYMSDVYLDVYLTAIAYIGKKQIKHESKTNKRMFRIPTMVGSNRCHLHNKSRSELISLKEDPNTRGGYFIMGGNERLINMTENILFNNLRIFRPSKNATSEKWSIRSEFYSEPGDEFLNSTQITCKYFKNKSLIFNIKRGYLSDLDIPFHLLFKLLGWNTHRQMLDYILCGDKSELMTSLFISAIEAPYENYSDENKVITTKHAYNEIVNAYIFKKKDSKIDLQSNDKKNNFIKSIKNVLFNEFFQHIGFGEEFNNDKAIFVAYIIRNMFLVLIGALEETDRDSLRYKRVATAGKSLSKIFKSVFNETIKKNVKKATTNAFYTKQFNTVDVKSLLISDMSKFEKGLNTHIVAGNKSDIMVGDTVRKNRLTSQTYERKNDLHEVSMLRQVDATSNSKSKQSTRSNVMRMFHPSTTGYICVTHSPEGESSGMNKNLTAFSFVSRSTPITVLKEFVRNDDEIIKTTDLLPSQLKDMCKVFVNGYWIGVCKSMQYTKQRYIQFRRDKLISQYTSVVPDVKRNELCLYCDSGRLIRPLLIVKNNFDEFDEKKNIGKKFKQEITIKPCHIEQLKKGTLSMSKLIKENVFEYVDSSEQGESYICPDLKTFLKNINDPMNRYTHLETPQSIIGFTALVIPYGHHSAGSRNLFQSSHGKQAIGIYSPMWPYHMLKNVYLHHITEKPLVRTFSNKYVASNGGMGMIAIICHKGYGQEDGLIVTQESLDKGSWCATKFKYYTSVLGSKETFTKFDANIERLKAESYDNINNHGHVNAGTKVKKGDPLVLKVQNSTENNELHTIDRSMIYEGVEDATVQRVFRGTNSKGEKFIKVLLAIVRVPIVGDKMSNRSGQKGVITYKELSDQGLVTPSGIRPKIYFNVHGIPSRMTINMIMEILAGKLCAEKGVYEDATTFKDTNMEDIMRELKELGFNPNGEEYLINSFGEKIESKIYMGPIFMQRLPKFVVDSHRAVNKTSSNIITNQPVKSIDDDSKALRLGEMETQLCNAHGIMRFMSEKLRDHSDRFVWNMCKCGRPAIVNRKYNTYKCTVCKDAAIIRPMETTYSSKMLMQMLTTANIDIRLKPEEFEY